MSLIEDYMYWLREDSSIAVATSDYSVNDKHLLGFSKGDQIEIISR